MRWRSTATRSRSAEARRAQVRQAHHVGRALAQPVEHRRGRVALGHHDQGGRRGKGRQVRQGGVVGAAARRRTRRRRRRPRRRASTTSNGAGRGDRQRRLHGLTQRFRHQHAQGFEAHRQQASDATEGPIGPSARNLERVKGIEPSYEAWEAAVLPLNYTRIEREFTRSNRSLEGAVGCGAGRLLAAPRRRAAWLAPSAQEPLQLGSAHATNYVSLDLIRRSAVEARPSPISSTLARSWGDLAHSLDG